MTARYLSKKSLKLTDAEKTQTFENFVRGRSRQDLTETCLGHLGPSLNHPRSWFSLTILFDPRWLQENRDRIIRFLISVKLILSPSHTRWGFISNLVLKRARGFILLLKLAEIMFMQKLISEKESCWSFDFLE